MSKFCVNCGASLIEGANNCTTCGVPINMFMNNGKVVLPKEQKSKKVAGLLGIFLGVFGVHNFYLGYTGKAVGQLLLTLLTFGLLSPISMIWGLIEGIRILTGSINVDAKGIPLKD